ncbi:MAG: 3-dehydroquinate synthase [Flavobacteriaceae bacterium]
MKSIQTTSYEIHFKDLAYKSLDTYLKKEKFSKIFLLVDENTHKHCLPHFLGQIQYDGVIEIIEIKSGEIHKTIETCMGVWRTLSELSADRKSLLINLGGGVVTDLGGFVASTFKRGIKFINVPTTLLAMVDASVGGKTGVDLDLSKNQIGTITFADMVLIDPRFLDTLPNNELRSGFAEMLKHGLIQDQKYWKQLRQLKQLTLNDLDELIHHSVAIKNKVVSKDPNEMGLRKILNFGHTLGHAIESYCLDNEDIITLLHGEAIAIGMILEGYLSSKISGLPITDLKEIKETFKATYPNVSFSDSSKKQIIELMQSDKKNSYGQVKFVLLESIGQCQIDVKVENAIIYEAFDFYSK